MNLAQVVWYSLAIGVATFFIIFTLSYISYRLRHSGVTYEKKIPMPQKEFSYNSALRTRPQKIVYVKKHSEIRKGNTITIEKDELRIRQEEAKKSIPNFSSRERTNGRFTVINETMIFTPENHKYFPSYCHQLQT